MARQANALKALHKELDDITEDNKAGLTLKLGRESFTLESGEYLGAAVGTEFAYVVQGKTTSVLALDRSKKTATILSDAQVTAKAADIRKDMLPEPEPPQDLLDALEKLRGSGWTVTVDAKGNPTLVPVGAGSTPRATRQRAPKGQGKPKAEPKPKFARGLKLQRVKDNAVYVIQSVDEAAKKMNLKADGGKETIEISIAPIQWKYWRVAP